MGVAWNAPAGTGKAEKPSAQMWAARSGTRSGPASERRCSNSAGPSGHSSSARRSSPVKPETVKSLSAPLAAAITP